MKLWKGERFRYRIWRRKGRRLTNDMKEQMDEVYTG